MPHHALTRVTHLLYPETQASEGTFSPISKKGGEKRSEIFSSLNFTFFALTNKKMFHFFPAKAEKATTKIRDPQIGLCGGDEDTIFFCHNSCFGRDSHKRRSLFFSGQICCLVLCHTNNAADTFLPGRDRKKKFACQVKFELCVRYATNSTHQYFVRERNANAHSPSLRVKVTPNKKVPLLTREMKANQQMHLRFYRTVKHALLPPPSSE